MPHPDLGSGGWRRRKTEVAVVVPKVKEPPHPIVTAIVDLFRNDRENWRQYCTPLATSFSSGEPLSHILVHRLSQVRVSIDNRYHVCIFIPGIGDFTFSGDTHHESAQLIFDLGNEIRTILALEYLKGYAEDSVPLLTSPMD